MTSKATDSSSPPRRHPRSTWGEEEWFGYITKLVGRQIRIAWLYRPNDTILDGGHYPYKNEIGFRQLIHPAEGADHRIRLHFYIEEGSKTQQLTTLKTTRTSRTYCLSGAMALRRAARSVKWRYHLGGSAPRAPAPRRLGAPAAVAAAFHVLDVTHMQIEKDFCLLCMIK
ncbi:hypothetical protein BZA05DRAFT_416270 [Tricharina praecox]|uniref:uncharacterized protein n=1 Tax=Tricharina praecox TaxID=43433 RepID=UPI002220483F|nr:uncharacterized protein BZA05DRAFT_416270 [Tricharina praecox]KAI5856617.1 hypothetical protein BZA05DRAFT_416270 [Tricharina praecox]